MKNITLALSLTLLLCSCAGYQQKSVQPEQDKVATLYLSQLGPRALETMVQLALRQQFGEADVGVSDEKWIWVQQDPVFSYPFWRANLPQVLRQHGYQTKLLEEYPHKHLALFVGYIDQYDGRIEIGAGILENYVYIRMRLIMATAYGPFRNQYRTQSQEIFEELAQRARAFERQDRHLRKLTQQTRPRLGSS